MLGILFFYTLESPIIGGGGGGGDFFQILIIVGEGRGIIGDSRVYIFFIFYQNISLLYPFKYDKL